MKTITGRTPRFALLAALALAALFLFVNAAFYHDDAYISLRYARHLLEGHGLVWNPGERVQGYTNFLHLLLVSALGFLGMDLVLASRVVGFAAYAALVAALVLAARRPPGAAAPHPLDLLPAVLVAGSAPLIVWALGGLEGTLFALLATLGALAFVRARYAAGGAWFALAALTRPDGIVFLGVSLLFLIARPGRARNTARFLLPALLLLVPYLVWQVSYYGDLVPNTFYAKAGGASPSRVGAGLLYVLRYLAAPPFTLVALVVLGTVALRKRAFDGPGRYLAALVLGYGLVVVYVGGDHMPAARLLLPLIPLAALAVAALLTRITKPGVKRAAALYAAAVTLSVTQAFHPWLNPRHEDPAAFFGAMVGTYIDREWPEGSLVALSTAGSTPYYADRHRYIDMLGLNDRHIARRRIPKDLVLYHPGHVKGDGAYVLSREPDFIILGPAYGATTENPWFVSDLEMARDRRFADAYELRRVNIDGNGRTAAAGSGLAFTYYAKIR